MLTRRTLLQTTAAALAASPALAEAPMLGASRPTYRRVTLGGFEVTTLLDGAVPVEGPQPIFGGNTTVEAVEGLLTENNLPTDRMEFTFNPVLVNTGSALILFDTGNGAPARPARGLLTDRIAEAGYSVDQVDTVVITHMHPDHIGGLLTDGAPTFPNAQYVIGEVEHGFWTSTDRVGTQAEGIHQQAMALAPTFDGRLTLIKPGDTVTSGIEALDAFGHTPGHMAYHFESEGARMVLTADAANHYVLSLQQPEWEVRFDMDKAAAAQTRKNLFGMLAADKVPFTGYHMPFPAMGFVERMGAGFRYVPASYQLNI
ncbi:MAG: MBL fold metallo-hydrolase [Pseudomonadota bacterium]